MDECLSGRQYNFREVFLSGSVYPQVVDFGSWQGSSVFATAGIVRLFRSKRCRCKLQFNP